MQWICFAFRPLTLTELRFALAVGADTTHTSISQCQRSYLFVQTDEDMDLRIRDLSKGLAEIRRDDGKPIVQFIHESVKDFLLEKGFQVLDKTIAGNVRGRGHFWLSRSCIKFVSMKEFRDFALSNREPASVDKEKVPWIFLLDYSLEFWLDHVKEVEHANMPQGDLATLDSKSTECDSHSWFAIYKRLDAWTCWNHWSRHLSSWETSNHTTWLHSASYHNLISVVRAILSQNVWADLNFEDSGKDTPFFIAVRRGHEAIVAMLLNRVEIDVNRKDSHGDTPLSIAVLRGDGAVLERLLNRKDVDVNRKSSWGLSPFSLAVRKGKEAILKMLLSRDDLDIVSVNVNGDAPLCEAAFWGETVAVEVLLERVANHKSNKDQLANTLLKAAKYGRYEIVQLLLLQQGCSADSKDTLGRTSLSHAAAGVEYTFGHDTLKYKETVKLFLDRSDVDINSRDSDDRTPLSYAAESGQKEVVQLFLDRIDVDVNSRASSKRTPLSYAIQSGQTEVVKLILDRIGVDINSRDSNDRTPLSFAAESGNNEVVRLLLDRIDVDVNSRASGDRTPLSYAAERGQMEVVKTLLDRIDVDVNSKDTRGKSPLSWALNPWPFRDVVDLLLSRKDIRLSREEKDALTKFFANRKGKKRT